MRLVSSIRRALRGQSPSARSAAAEALQFDGFVDGRIATAGVDPLTDEDLKILNGLLPWTCFTVDSNGRRFGNCAWAGKRDRPQPIPDRRIVQMNDFFGLKSKRVLEVGCFEGVHTIGLCGFGAEVVAIDSRIENVVKTIVRTAMFGYRPQVFTCNLEEPAQVTALPCVDLMHHAGVLYHLKDPIEHLVSLGRYVSEGLMLDTHVALPETATHEYQSNGRRYRYQHYGEGGKREVFSGMYDHAKWLLLDDIKGALTQAGFDEIKMVEERNERNGPRVMLFARRSTAATAAQAM